MLTEPKTFDPVCDLHPFKGELVRNAFWTVKLRWLGAAAIIGGSLLAELLGVIRQSGVLIFIGLAVLAYNALISWAMRPGKTRLTFQFAQRLWLIQILADVTSLTAIVYFCGGVESPLIIFYVFHVVCAGILLPARLSYLVASLATAFLGLVGVLQAALPELYHPLALSFAGQYYQNWTFVGLEVLAFGAAMYVAIYTTTAISKRLQAQATEQRQLEQKLRTSNREILAMSETLKKNQWEMAQREKMVAIGTMAAGIAHEIGNPLACLSAVVQLLNRQKHSADDSRHLHTLQEQIDRIAKIIKQLVDFARPAPTEWVVADLDDLIEQTLKILRYSLRVRQARIESIRNRNLPPVRIIPQQFQQILVNLLLNALDAVQGLEGEQVVRVERLAEDGWVKVMVKDTGCGMTEDQIRQALEPFYTTKPPGKGTGLGLAVCYRFIEYHRGRIDIDSVLGRGTTVTISFRAHSQQTKKVSSKQSANP